MRNGVVHLLDPEVIIPSPEAALSYEFWARMNDWAEYKEFLLGPATLEALLSLCSDDSQVRAIPMGDFWTLVGKFSSRVHASTSATRRVLCEPHLLKGYTPDFGSVENLDILIEDLESVPQQQRIALATVESCWNDQQPSCVVCGESKISRITDVESGTGVASIRRELYLEHYPSDAKALKEFRTELFPAIIFSDAAWNQVSSIPGDTPEVVSRLVKHLGVLNDDAVNIWERCKSTEDRQAAFGHYGVVSSPENANTHKNRTAMRVRQFWFKEREITCEWHTKLWPHIGRIYFAVEDSKIYVGLITDHL